MLQFIVENRIEHGLPCLAIKILGHHRFQPHSAYTLPAFPQKISSSGPSSASALALACPSPILLSAASTASKDAWTCAGAVALAVAVAVAAGAGAPEPSHPKRSRPDPNASRRISVAADNASVSDWEDAEGGARRTHVLGWSASRPTKLAQSWKGLLRVRLLPLPLPVRGWVWEREVVLEERRRGALARASVRACVRACVQCSAVQCCDGSQRTKLSSSA